MAGFFKIPRAISETRSWSQGAVYRGLIVTIYEKARWTDGFWGGEPIPKGAFPFSGQSLADELGISRRSLLRALDDLEKDGLISRRNAHNRFTVINIMKPYSYDEDNDVICTADDTADVTTDVTLLKKEERREDILVADEADDSQQPPVKKAPNCPCKAIVELYHEMLPELRSVKIVNTARTRMLKIRWNEIGSRLSAAGKPTDSESRLNWLRVFFQRVSASDFLVGKVCGNNGRRPFTADLDFIFSPRGFVGIIEGRYDNLEAR